MMPRRDGVFAALWSPTDPGGRLLTNELTTILALVRRGGTHGIMALGSTGEFLHLDISTRKELLARAVADGGGLPVIANISDIRPGVAVELGHAAKESGCPAVVLLPPYFFPMAQADVAEYFVRVGEAVGLPLWLYNFPERTGIRINPETVASVATRIPLAGIKQSGAEFGYHEELVKLGRAHNFVVFTGADTNLAAAMAMGVKGCVSGLANVVPELVVAIYNSVGANNAPETARLTAQLSGLAKLIGKVAFPLDVAAAMEARGLPVGATKCLLSEETKKTYQQVVSEVRSLFQEWKLV
ncbi:MAG TPA: dihydrodipicolinate synthase family protein [Verrucomicrobiae bacterium]|nr:dihydrodipicolinate synthase family protein [Verrucomicrobiae bacterium]